MILANGGHIEGTTGGHIAGDFSGIRTKKGKLCHSISIQSAHFVRQLSVENVRVFIFVSVTPIWPLLASFSRK